MEIEEIQLFGTYGFWDSIDSNNVELVIGTVIKKGDKKVLFSVKAGKHEFKRWVYPRILNAYPECSQVESPSSPQRQ